MSARGAQIRVLGLKVKQKEFYYERERLQGN
jgi:hypothetical protein